MCGINGILRLRPDAPPVDRDELLATREQMAARGPDGKGAWIGDDGGVGLANRRLAILDLTDAGAQPMASADGRHRLVVNGEIFNFLQLRAELEADGVAFRSTSDTEVILALYARHGLGMLERLRGMYALALWDQPRRRLLLARDPLGIKPLYYTAGGGQLRFASQVRALLAGGAVERQVDAAGLGGFLLWGSVPEPHTLWRGVRALPAGHRLVVEDGRLGAPEPHYRFGRRPLPGDGEDLPDLATSVEDSVRAHLVSDVPVAVFLSAGLDSSLVAALACRHLPRPPVTFTLSFDLFAGTALDEGPLAASTARALGTHHLERRVGREDFEALWPEALAAMDQPSIDGFNVFVVSRMAKEAGLTVVLTGVGGDELFGSYPSFTDVPRGARWARRARRLPGLGAAWPALARRLVPGRPKLQGLLAHGASLPGAYYLRRGLFLPEELPALLGRRRAAEALAAYDPVADAGAALAAVGDLGGGDGWLQVHQLETSLYLRNQLLRDADWASMASSVELRVPLVDALLRNALVADGFARVRAAGGKAALARQIAPELPAELFGRGKSGFYIPVPEWSEGSSRAAPGQRRGVGSRRLARRVLASFGVELDG